MDVWIYSYQYTIVRLLRFLLEHNVNLVRLCFSCCFPDRKAAAKDLDLGQDLEEKCKSSIKSLKKATHNFVLPCLPSFAKPPLGDKGPSLCEALWVSEGPKIKTMNVEGCYASLQSQGSLLELDLVK